MQNYTNIKKSFIYFIAALFIISFIGCASRVTIYTEGPFSKEYLETNKLIFRKTQNNIHTRIVYPAVISYQDQKQLIEQYIQTFPEKRVFDDLSIDKEAIDAQLDPSQEHYLAIYGYIMAYRLKIVSIIFQVQYWTNKVKKTERWYTLNYNKQTQAIIELNSLFQDFAGASAELERYIAQDMKRQDIQRNILVSHDTVSLKDTLHNFVFIPSIRYRNKFTGIQVYINTEKLLKDERTPHITNRNYMVNIPYSVIEPYMFKDVQKYFIKMPLSPTIEALDISQKHILVFPDLRDETF